MPLLSHQYIKHYVHERLTAAGVGEVSAARVAENLVDANLKGHDSHGVSKLPQYIASINAGKLDPSAHVHKLSDSGPLLSFSGQQGFGQVVAYEAIEEGIRCAQQYGVAVVGLSNAHHLGRLGAWAEQAASEGLVSLHFANVQTRNMVVPWGGVLPRMGTNPFCAGLPLSGRSPLILDFATSVVAANKVRIAWNEGNAMPEGCLVDAQGNPTTDPAWMMQAPKGALLPFGEHKGSGLSIVCALLGAALTGGETERTATDDGPHTINSMLSILIDPERLGSGDYYQHESLALVDWLYRSQPNGSLQLPGDPEQKAYEHRLKRGIYIDDVSWTQLEALPTRA